MVNHWQTSGAIVCIIIFGCMAIPAPPCTAQEERTAFPEIYDSEPETAGWCSPQQALEMLKLPEGFLATLFASEPEVQNPIAATVDPQGRVWIAENYTYAERSQRFDLNLNDRVVVLEDRDQDGVAEQRHVFTDSVQMLTGIAVGQGGVWLMCPPQLLFIPDRNGDLIPDGPPEVKLDGFHVARDNYHNFANGLSWGPDGWLVGRCGASCPGELGLPGSSPEERVPVRGGIWRFHPQRQVVEVLTHGTTNPWGHDWNDVGDLFFINTVNGHLWHAIPGAHFVRPHTIDANPYIYELIDMHADHWHFDTGRGWTASRAGAANDYGGGHAHVGMMIYQGQNWPADYRQKLMTINMHGRRVNVEELVPHGAGYVGRHAPDFALSDDVWFRGMDLLPLPDGNVLLIDWCDTGECHDHTGVHRTSGRVFKIHYGTDRPLKEQVITPELNNQPRELADHSLGGSEWHSRRARQVLRSMHVEGRSCAAAGEAFQAALNSPQAASTTRLRALWGLFQLEQTSQGQLLQLLTDSDPHLRRWAVRLLSDAWPIDNSDGSRPPRSVDVEPTILDTFTRLAITDPSAAVRLELASSLQRLPHSQRLPIARGLMSHAEDADDHNLPLMVWYGLTPMGEDHLSELITVVGDCQWPNLRQLIARRVADQVESQPRALELLMDSTAGLPPQVQRDVILGTAQGLAGRQRVPMPAAWPEVRTRAQPAFHSPPTTGGVAVPPQGNSVAEAVQQLDVVFGDGRAMDELRQLAADGQQPLGTRRAALQSLVAGRAPQLQALCLKLLGERHLNLVAAEGLALEDGQPVGAELVKRYRAFAPLDRPRVIAILASRSAWAQALLEAVATGEIERQEISAYDARQIASLGDESLTDRLAEVWGQVRETPAERLATMERIRQELTDASSRDLPAGRRLFDQHCASCHTMFGSGGKLGPDLTGAQRSDLNYLLDNIVDPSAVVTKEFRATIVMLQDGRVLTGLATSTTDDVLTLATQTEVLRIPTTEIEQVKLSTASTMPDGLLTNLSPQQLRDLFAYLQAKEQVAP